MDKALEAKKLAGPDGLPGKEKRSARPFGVAHLRGSCGLGNQVLASGTGILTTPATNEWVQWLLCIPEELVFRAIQNWSPDALFRVSLDTKVIYE